MRYSVIIADDEPLVLIGLQDLINWEEEGFEIVAQARNGGLLEEAIEKYKPDLVITDIKMPIKSGMEVLEDVRKKNEKLPLFVFLTSFEEFDLVKRAISLEAVDYIVKLEMDKTQLLETLGRAKKKLEEIKGSALSSSLALNEKQFLQDRYFMRLLFSIDTQDMNTSDLDLDLDYDFFTVAYITIPEIISSSNVSLYYSAVRLLEETIGRYTLCYLTQLDLGHLAAIFPFTKEKQSGYRSYIYSAFRSAFGDLKNFLSLSARADVGPLVGDADLISESFFKAKLLSAKELPSDEQVLFFDHSQNLSAADEPALAFDSEAFTRAFGELNAQLLEESINAVISEIRDKAASTVNAIDIASSILYMAMNLVPNGEDCMNEIFPKSESVFSYRCLYQARNPDEVIAWLEKFSAGFVKIFHERKQDYRLQTIQKVQAYINENVSKKLTLGSVASLFGYSQNYLSSLFSRYANQSFIDYVNTAKIEKAKQLLSDPNVMVYEVATQLGFESQFYFSRVFKKVTGVSPAGYQKSLQGKGENNAQPNQ